MDNHTKNAIRLAAVEAMMKSEAHQRAYALLCSFGGHPPQWARDAVAAAHREMQAANDALDSALDSVRCWPESRA